MDFGAKDTAAFIDDAKELVGESNIGTSISGKSCEGVDIAELEQIGESVKDLVVNVDLNDIQFDIDKLMLTAEQLGFDFDDLNAFGISLNSAQCGKPVCIDTQKLKDFDQFNRNADAFTKKMLFNGFKGFDRATCHPWM